MVRRRNATWLSGRTVVITGAGSGIGRCLAGEFGRKEARLILVDRDRAALDETVAQQGIADNVSALIVKDFMDYDTVEYLEREIRTLSERIDVVFHNAGLMTMGQFRHMHEADWVRMQRVNLDVPVRLTHALLPDMIAAGGGALGYTSSASALSTPPGASVYGMTKAGLAAFTEALRSEVHRHNISVTTICPGFVHSPMSQNIVYRDETARKRTTNVPRFIGSKPDRVARITVRAILRNRGLIVIGWDEKLKRLIKQISGPLSDWLNRGMARLLLDRE